MNLFQLGNFVLASGAKSAWKLECDALSIEDIQGLAAMIRQMIGPFSSVEGVPRGGLALVTALSPHVTPKGPHLIVDDVLTTGGSMERIKNVVLFGQPTKQVIGAVIFARGRCPSWIKAVFQMPECFWIK